MLRHQLASLIGEVDEDRARLHQCHLGVAVDDGRDAVVGADLEEFRLELLVLADVDRVHGVGQAEFFKGDGNLAAVGGSPGVEIDHGAFLRCSRTSGLREIAACRDGAQVGERTNVVIPDGPKGRAGTQLATHTRGKGPGSRATRSAGMTP